MSPSAGIAASQLRQLVYYHLDNDMVDNANFVAGRLLALEPRSPDAAHLLALTYLRSRHFKAAYDFSHRYGTTGRHLGCAYVFAQACLELGLNGEGVAALEKSRNAWAGKNDWTKHSETSRSHVPDSAAALTLLAKLWRAHGEMRKAGDCYLEAHKQNPFIWDAFEGLCKIGADINVEGMFRPAGDFAGSSEESDPAGIYVDEDSRQPLAPQRSFAAKSSVLAMDDPFTTSKAETGDLQHRMKGRPAHGKPALSEWDTPTGNAALPEDDTVMEEGDLFAQPPAAPSRRLRMGLEVVDRPRAPVPRAPTASQEPSEDIQQALRKPSAGGQKRTISGAVPASGSDSAQPRRSNRLFTQGSSTRTTRSGADTTASAAARTDRTARAAKSATGAKGRTGVVGRVVSGNRKIMPPDERDREKEKRALNHMTERTAHPVPVVTSTVIPKPPPAPSEDEGTTVVQRQAMAALLDNFKQLAVGCNLASKFELPEAIQSFRTLSAAQRETPWVLAQLGKAYYEQTDYKAAEDCFARLLKIQPSRIEDMEIYSTILWHLKKETALAFLCHSLRSHHFEAPQTWVAVGNAFSLSREHDQAIAAFRRATQVDENFAYAWTLMGHEYIANEAFDTGITAFRKAVTADPRHYNGWYGLGKCYERMGKLEDAERHYRIAASINPSNSTLLVCIGVILEHLHNKNGALANYARALELTPTSALARFKKARVLMHMKYFHDALSELETLRDQAPDEANVWFLLGKCFKGLGDRGQALRAFTTALNLDVKAAPFIKEAMEALDEEDEDSDDE